MSDLIKGCRAFVKYTDGSVELGTVQSIVHPNPRALAGSIEHQGTVYIWLDGRDNISNFPYSDIKRLVKESYTREQVRDLFFELERERDRFAPEDVNDIVPLENWLLEKGI